MNTFVRGTDNDNNRTDEGLKDKICDLTAGQNKRKLQRRHLIHKTII